MKKQFCLVATSVALLSAVPQVSPVVRVSAEMLDQHTQLKTDLKTLYKQLKALANHDTGRQGYSKSYATIEKSQAFSQLKEIVEKDFKDVEVQTLESIKDELVAKANSSDNNVEFQNYKHAVAEDYAKLLKQTLETAKNILKDAGPDYIKRLEEVAKKQDYEELTKEFQKSYEEVEAKNNLAVYKKTVQEAVKKLSLPTALKNSYLEKIQNAKSKEELDTLQAEAVGAVKAQEMLKQKKEEARRELLGKNDLDPQERTDFVNRVENGSSVEEVEAILREADTRSANNKVIFDKRQQIAKEIAALGFLTADHRVALNERLEQAQVESQLDSVLADAKQKNLEDLKAEEKGTLKKAKEILKTLRTLPELTDPSLYGTSMRVWQDIKELLGAYTDTFEKLKSPDTNDQELRRIRDNLYFVTQFGEVERIARELEQKRRKYPNNTELEEILKSMFTGTPYATIETGKFADFNHFLAEDIYPKQKKFENLFEKLQAQQVGPLTTLTSVVQTIKETKTEEIPFGVQEESNPELPKGQRRTKVAGVKGVRTIVEEVKKQGDKELSRTKVSEMITKPAVTQIVEVGTKEERKTEPLTPLTPAIKTIQEARTEEIPFGVQEESNPELPQGERRVKVFGVKGERTIIEEIKTQGDKELSRRVLSNTVTKEAVTQIVEIGTKVATPLPIPQQPAPKVPEVPEMPPVQPEADPIPQQPAPKVPEVPEMPPVQPEADPIPQQPAPKVPEVPEMPPVQPEVDPIPQQPAPKVPEVPKTPPVKSEKGQPSAPKKEKLIVPESPLPKNPQNSPMPPESDGQLPQPPKESNPKISDDVNHNPPSNSPKEEKNDKSQLEQRSNQNLSRENSMHAPSIGDKDMDKIQKMADIRKNKNGSSSDKKLSSLPKTGEASSLVHFVGVLMAGVATWIRTRKKED
ncbi:G5 domain-containing protein [Streptococcus himalayensis]